MRNVVVAVDVFFQRAHGVIANRVYLLPFHFS